MATMETHTVIGQSQGFKVTTKVKVVMLRSPKVKLAQGYRLYKGPQQAGCHTLYIATDEFK